MYDAIIVGARVAGASCAMLMARKGLKVLMLDRDAKGTDMPTSTHMIWQLGAKKLDDWGLLETVLKTGTTQMRLFDLDMGEFSLTGYSPAAGDIDIAIAPKRDVLDEILVDAAIDAGVEFRPETSLTGLQTNDQGAVIGINYTDKSGAKFSENASIVIGADGRNSSVAKFANAKEENAHDNAQGTYYAYFEDLPLKDMEFVSRPGRMFYNWATNDNQTLAGVCCNYEDFKKQNSQPEENYFKELKEYAPALYERVRDAKRVTEWRAGSTRGFMRQAYGSGWALVGDAGTTVDPISAAGITLAFRSAENLADAVFKAHTNPDAATSAMEEFAQQRDAYSLPMLGFSHEMGRLEEPPQEMIDLFVALQSSQDDIDAYFGVFGQTVEIQDFFDPENMKRIIEQAA